MNQPGCEPDPSQPLCRDRLLRGTWEGQVGRTRAASGASGKAQARAPGRRGPRQRLGRPHPQGSRPPTVAAPQPTRLRSGPSCSRGCLQEGGAGRSQSSPAPHLLVPPCGPKVHQGLPLGVPRSKPCALGPPPPSLHSLPSGTTPTPASPSPSWRSLQPPLPTSRPWPSPLGGHVEPGAHHLQGQALGVTAQATHTWPRHRQTTGQT